MPNEIKKTALIFLSVLILSNLIIAQQEKKAFFSLRIVESIEVDGILDEPAWEKAPEANDLLQVKSWRSGSESASTSVKILFDDDYIYIGFLCFDSQPDKIESYATERDMDLRDDDSVFVLIEAAYDRDHYYYFGTNLNGTQSDGKVNLDGRSADSTWNGNWKSVARKTDSGWNAEIAIDLTCLEYQPKAEKVVGISLSRIVPRMLETSFWSGALDPAFKISQLGQLEKIGLAEAEKKLKISPHVISSIEEEEKKELGAGLNMSYDFSPTVSAQLTVYPDFGTVEADEEQVNLTRYELYIPEKRDFFLGGSRHYDQEIRLFYTKRIYDIYGGFKLNGRSGGFEFSGMSVQTKEDVLTNQDPANFSVVRFKTGFLKSSSIGILAANKSISGKNIGAAGIDASLRFGKNFGISGQFAYSYGDFEEENIAYFIRPSYESKIFRVHLSYLHLGQNFGDNVNEVGFIQDDNRRELDSGLGITFIRDKGKVEEFKYDSNYNVFWSVDGNLRSWQFEQGISAEFKSKFTLSAQHFQEFKAQDNLLYEKDFRNHRTTLGVAFNAREWEYAILSVTVGKNFGWNFNMLDIRKNIHVSKSLDVEFNMARTYYMFGRSGMNDFVSSIRAINTFNEKLFVKVFYQYHAMIKKFNLELLVNYQILPPLGFIQLVYQVGRARFGESYGPGNTFFLKIGYSFQ
ncbi:MAG: carbohydrate binding family 9 domain-containing protein [Candidatus Aminicenantes bacterium]|nr:carbohydrate binding family 9 domain-containing protein [Candidatus Aminicenantes bacterium]